MKPERLNADKPHLWKADIAASVDQFNQWFMRFAPEAFRGTRIKTTEHVKAALLAMDDLKALNPDRLRANPGALPTLRMCTAPPLAVDRLIGLSGANKSLVGNMEAGKLAMRMKEELLSTHLTSVCRVLNQLLDRDLFPWLDAGTAPTAHERDLASTTVADRLCRVVVKDAFQSARKKYQCSVVAVLLDSLGYRETKNVNDPGYETNDPDTYAFDVALPLAMGNDALLPIDVLVRPRDRGPHRMPMLIDMGSSQGVRDAIRIVNRATHKQRSLQMTYGVSASYELVLSGVHNAGSLGTLAAEGIDWAWLHRVTELASLIG